MKPDNIARKNAQWLPFAVLCVIVIFVSIVVFPSIVAGASSQKSITITATIVEPIPEANFYAEPPLLGLARTVTFIDQSTGVGQSTYFWDFGDGGTSTAQTPPYTHAYTIAGTYDVTLTLTNRVGISSSSSRIDYITVYGPITFLPTGPSLPAGVVDTAYPAGTTITASTGSETFTYSLTAGSLPPNLQLNSDTGLISGTPTTPGTYPFTITATDTSGNGLTATHDYSILVNPAITLSLTSLPAGVVGTAYSQTITASGGSGSFTFSLTGSLPDGLIFGTSGNTATITGSPATAGTSPSFTITATDTNGYAVSQSYSILVNPAITLSLTSLPAGVVGTAYSQTITASGGSGTFTFSVLGDLPPGLSLGILGNTATISGSPTTAGTSPSFTLTATDTNGYAVSQSYSILVNPAITLTPTSPVLPVGDAGTTYPATPATTITASGGTEPYTYEVTAGKLPDGLTLNPGTGIISGKLNPTAVTSTFTITATDSATPIPHKGSQEYTITVNPPSSAPDTGGSDTGAASAAAVSEQGAVAGTQAIDSLGVSLSVNGISIATGAAVTVNGNVVTITTPTFTVTYVSGKITEIQGTLISQDAGSMTLSTESVEASIPGVGDVSGSVEAGIDSISDGAEVNLTLAKPKIKDILAFTEALKKEGEEIDDVAFTMTVTKANITANLPAKITMTVPPDWIARHGGTSVVRIVRTADDGTTQVLPTTLVGIDFTTGNFVFEALSKDGLSVFGLVTVKATVTEKAEEPNTTVLVSSKSIVSTDVGMAVWVMSTIEQNPALLVIVFAVIALVAYFGWWKRRL